MEDPTEEQPNPGTYVCPYCGGNRWGAPLGSGELRSGTLVLGRVDEFGETTLIEGVEVVAYTCLDCGYIRFHDPNLHLRGARGRPAGDRGTDGSGTAG